MTLCLVLEVTIVKSNFKNNSLSLGKKKDIGTKLSRVRFTPSLFDASSASLPTKLKEA